MRCFVGVGLSPDLADTLARATAAVRAADDRWQRATWVAEENLHITIKFLGDIDETATDLMTESLAGICSATRIERIVCTGISAVPSPRRARMLWATFADPDDRLATFAEQVDQAAVLAGVASEERAFKPHATLCRKRKQGPVHLQALEQGSAVVSKGVAVMSDPSCTLYASRLTPHGPVYTILGSWHLRGE